MALASKSNNAHISVSLRPTESPLLTGKDRVVVSPINSKSASIDHPCQNTMVYSGRTFVDANKNSVILIRLYQ